jgi:hypothetical protein
MIPPTPTRGSGQQSQSLFPEAEPDDLSSHVHRQLIGWLGLALPLLLWVVTGVRSPQGPARWRPLTSVSAYYYSAAVAAFVGILFALAVFFFAYRGYANQYARRDRRAALIAGAAALLVAFFPTAAPNDVLVPTWWTPLTGRIHYGSAAILFGSFIFFAVVQFPKSMAPGKDPLPRGKRVRNGFYYFCGITMAGCVAWALVAALLNRAIFWPETLALESFATSWLVKGRAEWTAMMVGKRAMHYGRHPGQLIGEIWSAIRP